MGRWDYSTTTVDGAAGFERCRQMDEGPYEDDPVTLADVCDDPDDEEDDEQGTAPALDTPEAEDAARQAGIDAEAATLLDLAKKALPGEWAAAQDNAAKGSSPDHEALAFCEAAADALEAIKNGSDDGYCRLVAVAAEALS